MLINSLYIFSLTPSQHVYFLSSFFLFNVVYVLNCLVVNCSASSKIKNKSKVSYIFVFVVTLIVFSKYALIVSNWVALLHAQNYFNKATLHVSFKRNVVNKNQVLHLKYIFNYLISTSRLMINDFDFDHWENSCVVLLHV